MRELTGVLRTWRADPQSGVLATVVHVEGSAYRRPGARRLIGTGGRRTGTISGGCLEADVARKAEWWTSNGPVLRVYDTASDEDAAWEFGLGCNGVIYVLLERVDSVRTQMLLTHLDRCQEQRRAEVVATVIHATDGSVFDVGDHYCGLDTMPRSFAGLAAKTLALRQNKLLHLPDADVFLEYVEPSQRLVIFGAGHDVLPLVSSANLLGWRVTVADARLGSPKLAGFPEASTVTLPASGDIDCLDIDTTTNVVFMTHNFPLDKRLLPQVLSLNPRYLGLLGPWKRTERLFTELGLAARGANLHAPAGLDLGGDSPESIALAIIAEIQATLNGRNGGELRWRRDPIHNPVDIAGDSVNALALAYFRHCGYLFTMTIYTISENALIPLPKPNRRSFLSLRSFLFSPGSFFNEKMFSR